MIKKHPCLFTSFLPTEDRESISWTITKPQKTKKIGIIKDHLHLFHTSILDIGGKISIAERLQKIAGDVRFLLPFSGSRVHLRNSMINSLEKVQVTHVEWWILRYPNFIIIENHPPTIFVYMGNIMSTVCRCTNVAH